jgi:RNA polymerase sigma factor (sigma-70 family)
MAKLQSRGQTTARIGGTSDQTNVHAGRELEAGGGFSIAAEMAAPDRARDSFERGRHRSAPAEKGDFGDVYERHVWHVYGFFGYRVNSRHEAEDLTQLTFERALRAWKRFDPSRATALTWLLAIARNLLIDHFRRSGPVPVDPLDDLPELVGSAEDPGIGLAPDLERALGALGDRDREIVALRYGGDLTGPEIAEMTGLTLANVQQILSRSLRRLRAELEGRES